MKDEIVNWKRSTHLFLLQVAVVWIDANWARYDFVEFDIFLKLMGILYSCNVLILSPISKKVFMKTTQYLSNLRNAYFYQWFMTRTFRKFPGKMFEELIFCLEIFVLIVCVTDWVVKELIACSSGTKNWIVVSIHNWQ